MNELGMIWMKESEEARIKRIPSFLVEPMDDNTQRGRGRDEPTWPPQ